MNTFNKLWGVVTPEQAKEKIEEETHLGNLSDVMKYYKPLDKEVR